MAGLGEVMDTGEEAMLVVEEVMDLGAVVVVAAVAVAVAAAVRDQESHLDPLRAAWYRPLVASDHLRAAWSSSSSV